MGEEIKLKPYGEGLHENALSAEDRAELQDPAKKYGPLFAHWSKDPAVPYLFCSCPTCREYRERQIVDML